MRGHRPLNEDLDPIVTSALDRLGCKAEPKLEAALAQHGVRSPHELSPEVAGKIFQDILIQTAAESFPDTQIDALKHGMASFQHPRFGPAFNKLKAGLDGPTDAFAFASGPESAIVLAAFGLPVAPFDRKQPRILAVPSADIDQVAANFSRIKTAFVGYSPCDIPFYMLLTDCVRSMRLMIESRPELQDVKRLLERCGTKLPQGSMPGFQHGIVLIAREPGDSVRTVFLNNPNPTEGSVALYAGWTIDGVREGAPNDGFIPVPLQFLEAALEAPQIAMWLWRPVGIRVALN